MGKPRLNERVGDGRWRRPTERGGACHHGEALDKSARVAFARYTQISAAYTSFARQYGDDAGFAVVFERAQNIEANDIAGTFPDRVDRRFAIQPWQQALFDVAVAAEAFHRLEHEARRQLANPVFGRWRQQPCIV